MTFMQNCNRTFATVIAITPSSGKSRWRRVVTGGGRRTE